MSNLPSWTSPILGGSRKPPPSASRNSQNSPSEKSLKHPWQEFVEKFKNVTPSTIAPVEATFNENVDSLSNLDTKPPPVEEVKVEDGSLNREHPEENLHEEDDVRTSEDYYRLVDNTLHSAGSGTYSLEVEPCPTNIPDFIDWLYVNFHTTLKADREKI